MPGTEPSWSLDHRHRAPVVGSGLPCLCPIISCPQAMLLLTHVGFCGYLFCFSCDWRCCFCPFEIRVTFQYVFLSTFYVQALPMCASIKMWTEPSTGLPRYLVLDRMGTWGCLTLPFIAPVALSEVLEIGTQVLFSMGQVPPCEIYKQ